MPLLPPQVSITARIAIVCKVKGTGPNGMLIHEHTVIRAADIAIRTRSYINALFLVAFDFDLALASDIVNLFAFLVDNRDFTLLFSEINSENQNWYLGQMPFLSWVCSGSW